jgi:hypothetical protein
MFTERIKQLREERQIALVLWIANQLLEFIEEDRELRNRAEC